MATLLRVTVDHTQERNALLALQSRVEGTITRMDDPVTILRGTGFLEVQLPDALPEEELRSVIKGIANLVGRPESGITGAVSSTPENLNGIQRSYSTP
jgi:hypothetical protein